MDAEAYMSFPQTQPLVAVQNGQDIWRLKTMINTPGDIYESDISARALVIGPNSDVARMKATYFDPLELDRTNVVEFSVDKPYIARLDARPAESYPTGDAARILFSTADLTFPGGFTPDFVPLRIPFARSIALPSLDVFVYMSEQPQFVAPRVDRAWQFDTSNPGVEQLWYLVPFYGRRFLEITIAWAVGGANVPGRIAVAGINFSNNITNPASHQQILLNSAIAPISPFFYVNQNLSFDYIGVAIDAGDAQVFTLNQFQGRFITSDRV
jgi:hypothetical protein